jgi:antitoxin Phd
MRTRRMRRTSNLTPPEDAQPASAQFTATQAKNEFGRVLETALKGGTVVITKHDVPKAIIISVDDYRKITHSSERALDTLTSEFDALYARMQTRDARKARQAAFEASPEELGKAAVMATRKRG